MDSATCTCPTKPPCASYLFLLPLAELIEDYLHYSNHLAPLFLIGVISRRVLRSDNSIIPPPHALTLRIISPFLTTTGTGVLPLPLQSPPVRPVPHAYHLFPLGRQKNERRAPEELRLGLTTGYRRIKANNKLVTAVANK